MQSPRDLEEVERLAEGVNAETALLGAKGAKIEAINLHERKLVRHTAVRKAKNYSSESKQQRVSSRKRKPASRASKAKRRLGEETEDVLWRAHMPQCHVPAEHRDGAQSTLVMLRMPTGSTSTSVTHSCIAAAFGGHCIAQHQSCMLARRFV